MTNKTISISSDSYAPWGATHGEAPRPWQAPDPAADHMTLSELAKVLGTPEADVIPTWRTWGLPAAAGRKVKPNGEFDSGVPFWSRRGVTRWLDSFRAAAAKLPKP